MNKETTEQTDELETIITELTKLNDLNHTGHSIDTMSRFITEDNVINLKFARKFEHFESMDVDVCIIQECEKLKEDYFPNAKFFGRAEWKIRD